MKRREYAASLGLAIAGARGRLSREALAAIEKAHAEGMTFDDDGAVKTSSTHKEKSEKTVKHSFDGSGDSLVKNETRYPMDSSWEGKDSNGKKHRVSGRNVCRNCGYSLCGHTCNIPVTLFPNLETGPVVMVG